MVLANGACSLWIPSAGVNRQSVASTSTECAVVNNPAIVGPYRCGRGERLLVIAGPCVIENAELTLSIAGRLAEIAAKLPIQLVFKASFDKANRTSVEAFRGPGLRDGLAILERVKRTTGLPVTTDIHE